MKTAITAVAGMFLFCQASLAQNSISSDVTIGPNGITINSNQNGARSNVKIGPGGISVDSNDPASKSSLQLKPKFRMDNKFSGNIDMKHDGKASMTVKSSTDIRASVKPAASGLGDLVLNNNHEVIKGHCNGNSIVINGNNCELALTGNVKMLTINGNHNSAKTDRIGILTVNGNTNSVTWSRASTPKLFNSGNKNELHGQ